MQNLKTALILLGFLVYFLYSCSSNRDTAIQSGSLVMELHPWYGSAALVEVNTIHNKIKK